MSRITWICHCLIEELSNIQITSFINLSFHLVANLITKSPKNVLHHLKNKNKKNKLFTRSVNDEESMDITIVHFFLD